MLSSRGGRGRVLALALSALPSFALVFVARPASAVATNGRIFFDNARTGNLDIWSMEPDGSDQQQLTTDILADQDPAPSPDGSSVGFVAARDGNQEIYLMDADGSGQTNLTATSANETEPNFSPDGTKIAYVQKVGLFDSRIWVMNADGSNQVGISPTSEVDRSPTFSPDGLKIAFVRSSTVWIMDADGQNELELTAGTDPAFMTDGRIVFRKSNEIYVMDADGANLINLTNDAGLDADPTPSPDGQKIAWVTYRNSQFDIFVMGVDGTNPTNVTTTSVDDTSPAWASLSVGAPSTTITEQPTSITTDTTPTFSFVADEVATFECSLKPSGQPDAFALCLSGYTASPALSDGSYVFKVRATDLDLNVESPPQVVTFTVDTTGPTASIGGSTPTNDATPTFSFSFNEDVQASTQECSVTASGGSDSFSVCSSPFTQPTPLSQGDYTFKVKASDVVGNPGPTASFVFTVDTTGPVATVSPQSPATDNTPTFAFSFDEAVQAGSPECAVTPTGSSDSFSACASPFTPSSPLPDGTYEFKVRATDTAGNLGAATAEPFIVDTTGPVAAIDGVAVTNDPTPTFTFSFNEPVQDPTRECALTPAGGTDSFSACSSPFIQPTSLSDGSHVFKVRATDVAGNQGLAASFAFTVDTVAPMALVGGPSLSNDQTPTFSFSFSETTQAGTVMCSLVPQGSGDSFYACSTPFTPGSDLTDGDYLFKVMGTDPAGNVGPPASHPFTVDSAAPTVTITGPPPALTNDTTPSFSFSSPDAVAFQCSLEISGGSDDFSACSSPFTSASALSDWGYVLKVRGTDAAGNDAEVLHNFTVDATAPTASVGGAALTNDATPTFTFSFSEAVQGAECSLAPSGGPDSFAPCTSPFTSPSLPDGAHVFKVAGTDLASNVGPAAVHAFTVDATAPVVTISGPTKTTKRRPTFTIAVLGDYSTLVCSVDGKPFVACSPTYKTSKLKYKTHTLEVNATDAAGNVGTDTHTFKVKRP